MDITSLMLKLSVWLFHVGPLGDVFLQNCGTVMFTARLYVCASCFGLDTTLQVTSPLISIIITITERSMHRL